MKLDTTLTSMCSILLEIAVIANVILLEMNIAAAALQSNHFCYWHVDDS